MLEGFLHCIHVLLVPVARVLIRLFVVVKAESVVFVALPLSAHAVKLFRPHWVASALHEHARVSLSTEVSVFLCHINKVS